MVLVVLSLVSLFLLAGLSCPANGEDRSFDGSGNNVQFPLEGAANQPLARITYPNFSPPNGPDGFLSSGQLLLSSPRAVSNAVSRQTEGVPSARNLSDYIWVWGQFVAHDLSLSLTSDGPEQNGTAPIAVGADDVLSPGPIPFVRSNFVTEADIAPNRNSRFPCIRDCREQINVNTSYLDASTVYGSSAERAMALRSEDGEGARLLTGEHNLLPLNLMGLENENNGRLADDQMFVAGDLRSNENVLLTSMHTVFMREHNRLVDSIESHQAGLTSEETYQLARRLVGAQVQAITYNEFLPALMGPTAPLADEFEYSPSVNASVTQSFSHAVYRWGHSATSPELALVDGGGQSMDPIELSDAFSSPQTISEDPVMIDHLLRGAATQVSQEIDTLVVDGLRDLLFGQPGNGGMDLVALNIQRGRDHGLPVYGIMQTFYDIRPPTTDFSDLREGMAESLMSVYSGRDAFRMDAWVGAMAERPLPDGSLGRLAATVISDQFERLRDGDRLFYRSDDTGLYEDGELKDEISQIIDLDSITLAQVIQNNTDVEALQANVFFVHRDLDFSGDSIVDAVDIDLLSASISNEVFSARFDLNGDGMVSILDHALMLREQRIIGGDANLDGIVSFPDFLTLSGSFGQTGGWAEGDFDASGSVAFPDFLELSGNFGQASSSPVSVPEPNAVWILFGLMVFSVRWRACHPYSI